MGKLLNNSGKLSKLEIAHMKEVRKMVTNKWDDLGFLEGLKGHVKPNIAMLFESKTQQMLDDKTEDLEFAAELDKFKQEIKETQNNKFYATIGVSSSYDDIYNKKNVMTDEQISAFDEEGEPLQDQIIDIEYQQKNLFKGLKTLNNQTQEEYLREWGVVTRWNYNEPSHHNHYRELCSQKDWNQTLITKINEISASVHQRTNRGGANQVMAHTNMKPLFEALEYTHTGDDGIMVLGSRYKILFTDDIDENQITVKYDFTERDKKGDFVLIPISTNNVGEMALKLYHIVDDKEIVDEYKRKCTGFILVDNYTQNEENSDMEYFHKNLAKSLKISDGTNNISIGVNTDNIVTGTNNSIGTSNMPDAIKKAMTPEVKDYKDLLGMKPKQIFKSPGIFTSERDISVVELSSTNFRRLKTTWSPEFAQDIQAYNCFDVDKELLNMLTEHLGMELNKEEMVVINKANTCDELLVAMDSLGFTLSSTVYDPMDFSPKKYWIKSEE